MSKIKETIKNNKILYTIAHCGKAVVYWCYEKAATLGWSIRCFLTRGDIVKQDTRFESIKQLQNTHFGERCFIVATGPSVTHDDLNSLKHEFSISMNSIVNILPEVDYRPSLYICQDLSVFERVKEKYNLLPDEAIYIGVGNTRKYFSGSSISLKDVEKFKNIGLFHLDGVSNVFHINFNKKRLKPKLSYDCYKDIKDGTTVTYSAIQMAVYMGFKEIYLIGVDCNYTGKVKHIGEYNPDADMSAVADDIVNNSNKVFGYASRKLEKIGVKLYNATRGGNLNTVPRADFDTLKELFNL